MTLINLDELRRMVREPSNSNTDRPVVRVSVELHETVDQAIGTLSRDPSLYQRDGELVRIVRIAETEADATALVGTPAIRRVTAATLRERLTNCAAWERFDARADDYRPCLPPETVTNAVLARGEFPGVRPVVGIAEAPLLSADGSVVEHPGYDEATGYVYLPNAEFPPVPAEPTQDDARAALAELAEVFCDFPYRSEADRMLPIAAVLTMLARPAIRGNVPAFIFDANTRGSGKTKQIDAVSIIATGRGSAKMNYPGDDAELEKVLGAYALQGAAMIAFDNVVTHFGGGPLDRVLTAGNQVALRVLGRSELPSLQWRAVVFATGNNVSTIGDTTRRVLLCRLESPLERPEDREGFLHPNLLEWVESERPRLVAAALTILRAFVVAGRPQPGGKPWGSFEAWAELIPAAIVYAGGADPMGCRLLDEAEDPEKAALLAILEHWPRLAPEGTTAKAAIAALYPADRLRGECPPDGFDDLREAIETLVPTVPGKAPSPVKFGYALRRLRGRCIGGASLEGRPNRNGVTVWTAQARGMRGIAGDFLTLRAQTVGTNQAATAELSPSSPASPALDYPADWEEGDL